MKRYQALGATVIKTPHDKGSLTLEKKLQGKAQIFGVRPFLSESAEILKTIINNYDYSKQFKAALEVAKDLAIEQASPGVRSANKTAKNIGRKVN